MTQTDRFRERDEQSFRREREKDMDARMRELPIKPEPKDDVETEINDRTDDADRA